MNQATGFPICHRCQTGPTHAGRRSLARPYHSASGSIPLRDGDSCPGHAAVLLFASAPSKRKVCHGRRTILLGRGHGCSHTQVSGSKHDRESSLGRSFESGCRRSGSELSQHWCLRGSFPAPAVGLVRAAHFLSCCVGPGEHCLRSRDRHKICVYWN